MHMYIIFKNFIMYNTITALDIATKERCTGKKRKSIEREKKKSSSFFLPLNRTKRITLGVVGPQIATCEIPLSALVFLYK